MAVIYGVGLVMALLTGGAIGVLLTAAHYERLRSQQEEYEEEMAGSRDFYVVPAMPRHTARFNPADDGSSAA